MAFNVQGSVSKDTNVQLALVTFGGLVTDMPPMNLPEGASPDNQECIFNPGKVGSRPGFRSIFGTAIGSATFTYGKTYLDPVGVVRNLYLSSEGEFLVQTGGFGGTPAVIGVTGLGLYAKSVTAFGREYIAISDGLRGQEVPLQYDGTNLDRVTQDGPGAAPTVTNLQLPAVSMVTGSGVVLTIVSATTINFRDRSQSYGSLQIIVAGGALAVFPGQPIIIAGSSNLNLDTSFPVAQIVDDNTIIADAYYTTFETGTGGTATVASYTMTRANNIVTVSTATDHNLQVGYRAQISGVPPNTTIGGGIVSLVINNAQFPGMLTVTTHAAHGLAPGTFIDIIGVKAQAPQYGSPPVAVTITVMSREGQVVTAETNLPHGLSVGASITVENATDDTFNCSAFVTQIVTPQKFVFIQAEPTNNPGPEAADLLINWPFPDIAAANTFEVVATPSPDVFQVALNYADCTFLDLGSYDAGLVTQAWDGIFYVSAVPDATTFQYRQAGPDAITLDVGTVTPYGQIAPGVHQMVVLYVTRQKAITKPSPAVRVTANGGQYLTVTNIPIGPPNVIARILAFTGVDGSQFFYIPATPQVNGQIVGTSTQIDDNTTTAVVLDFADPTLFAGIGISEMGNDLASQMILDSCLGFGYYADRLIAYGMRNVIQNLLGMSFDSGAFPSTPTIPTGWTDSGGSGALTTGHYGIGWLGTGSGTLTQSFYQDSYGAAIGRPNQAYRFRAWLEANATLSAEILSVSTGFSSTVTLSQGATSGWVEGAFSVVTPATIPTDMQLSIVATGLVDEMNVIYADNPFLDRLMVGSYRNNPEGFDGVSGPFGPSDDTHKIMCFAVIRGTLYLLTRDPSGRLHSTVNNGVTEPAGWTVTEVGTQCGAVSAFGLTVSQADDGTGAGGEEWMAWASQGCARIFGGDQPWKLMQEIQPDWNRVNTGALLTIWALNDSVTRRIYFGLPISGSAPTRIYVVDYKNLDTAYEIAQAMPVGSGRGRSGDHARKWTRWMRPMNGAAIMFSSSGQSVPVFLGGTGTIPGGGSPPVAGYGNVYYLASQCTDDDFGVFDWYYVTYFFPSPEIEGAVGLGGQRKTLAYLQWLAQIPEGSSASGNHINVSVLVNQLNNPWPLGCQRNLVATQSFDQEWPGGSAEGQRMAFKFEGFAGTI